MKLTRYRTVPYLRTGHDGHRSAGRNHLGRITVRHRGGGHARALISVDWNRNDTGGRVVGFAYDPRRSARLAVVLNSQTTPNVQQRPYSYVLAAAGRSLFQPVRTHQGMKANAGSSALNEKLSPPAPGDRVVVGNCEPGDFLHAVEPHSNHGPRIARAAGSSVQVIAVDSAATLGLKTGRVTVRLPSGAQRNIPAQSIASLGRVANSVKTSQLPGKAGRSRWLGRRPTVRGVAMNPVDHPHGGNTAGGRPSVTFRGWPTKGQPTRAPRRQNRFLIPVRVGNLLKMSRSS